MNVMMSLVIIVTEFAMIIYQFIYLLTLCYWYKLVQVHVHVVFNYLVVDKLY